MIYLPKHYGTCFGSNRAIEIAYANKIPVVVRGSGTGLVGAAVASKDRILAVADHAAQDKVGHNGSHHDKCDEHKVGSAQHQRRGDRARGR